MASAGTNNMPQVDITPATNPSLGIHFHGTNGQSANTATNPSDFPSGKANSNGAPAVTVKVTGTDRVAVRFANPS
jgi:hypothetical protein